MADDTSKPDPDESSGISQDDIDALLNLDEDVAADAETEAEESSNPEPDAVPDEGGLDQASIDALLNSADEPSAPTPEGLTDDSQVGGEEIDNVIADAGNAADDAPIDQSLIDAIVGSDEAEKPEYGVELGQEELDALTNESGAAHERKGGSRQDDIDALIAGEEPADSDRPADDSSDYELSQDDLDGLFDQAQPGKPSEGAADSETAADDVLGDVASEEDATLSPDMLDSLIEQAHKAQESDAESEDGGESDGLDEVIVAPPEQTPDSGAKEDAAREHGDVDGTEIVVPDEVAAATEVAQRPKKKPLAFGKPVFNPRAFFQQHGFKLACSVAAGLTTAACVYAMLALNPTRPMDARVARTMPLGPIEDIISQARELIAVKRYGEAAALLEPAIDRAPDSPAKTDAEYLHIEASYKDRPKGDEALALIYDIDDFLLDSQTDPRAGQVLYWQGKLYEEQGLVYPARQVYERLLRSYANTPNRDRIMLEIGKLSLDLGRTDDASDYLRRILQESPQSPVASEAKLMLGDVYRKVGERAAARAVYRDLAQTVPETEVGVEAFARLGQMAFQEGNYEDAIQLFQERQQRALVVDGNDEIFLLLARAHRALGNYDKAEQTLDELIAFFPDSPELPDAYTELVEVLDAKGERDRAVQLALQAAQRFSDNPLVLEKAGDLLARTGESKAAAEKYEEAVDAGASEADILLKAGREYASAGNTLRSGEMYDQLTQRFPASPGAVEAGIRAAEQLYEQGSTREAIERLESLILTIGDSPERLPVLLAQAAMFRDLGLDRQSAERYREIAQLASDPEVLAESAMALIEAGDYQAGYDIYDRIPIDQLDEKTAYNVMYAQGKARVKSNPETALEYMEQAHENYPDARTEKGEELLFTTYLATGNVAQARSMLTQLTNKVRQNPVYGHQLRKRALEWAEFNYERQDFRTALEGYELVLDTAGSLPEDDLHWTRFQRANALRKTGQEQDALAAYEAIADTGSPWAEPAASRARAIRLEATLRGTSYPPSETES